MYHPESISAGEKLILRWNSIESESARDDTIFTGKNHQIDLARLEDEFRDILLSQTSPIEIDSVSAESTHRKLTSLESDSSGEFSENDSVKQLEHQETNSSIREVDLIPSDAVNDLRYIAEQMIDAGYTRECVQVYASVRKNSVEESLERLNVEKLSIGDIYRLDWETVETKIRRWIRAAKISVHVIFASERRLCEVIFEGLGDSVDDACFVATVVGSAVELLNFAEAISISQRTPEKLFKILDLHDALYDLMPDIENIFESNSAESVRVQAGEILSRLADAARVIFSEFENVVLHEPSKIPIPGGTVHPLTRYVMNYLSLISDYKQSLIDLIVSKPVTGSRYSGNSNMPDMDFSEFEGDNASALALHVIWIIVILQFNLDGKSKHYKDASLAHLFMMNNVHYIVRKIKQFPELREMIGDYYLKKLSGKIRVLGTNYQRATWLSVLYCLRDEGLHLSGSFSSGVSKSALRDRFKAFNSMFEEVHKTQALWFIPDYQLREELRISILEHIIPAYRSFLGRFRIHIENGRHPENYIKFSVEDLENAVLDFFEGHSVSQNLRRKH